MRTRIEPASEEVLNTWHYIPCTCAAIDTLLIPCLTLISDRGGGRGKGRGRGKKKGLRDEEDDDDDEEEEEPPIKEKKKGKPTLILYTNNTEFNYFRRKELKRWGAWKRKSERSWLVQPKKHLYI